MSAGVTIESTGNGTPFTEVQKAATVKVINRGSVNLDGYVEEMHSGFPGTDPDPNDGFTLQPNEEILLRRGKSGVEKFGTLHLKAESSTGLADVFIVAEEL